MNTSTFDVQRSMKGSATVEELVGASNGPKQFFHSKQGAFADCNCFLMVLKAFEQAYPLMFIS